MKEVKCESADMVETEKKDLEGDYETEYDEDMKSRNNLLNLLKLKD